MFADEGASLAMTIVGDLMARLVEDGILFLLEDQAVMGRVEEVVICNRCGCHEGRRCQDEQLKSHCGVLPVRISTPT